ncbi:hypothetical protein AMAG_18023 [Allomyces macrogynus ATCC 38327]|uniref:Uncharacterized protein n=1 Tax=Allomyces macrogynus (strain ATCC 38327) TaxID=578462 RepID=A0A0L0S3U9_ALLM3|nr:hypothetical protein AMAG_18023 [Allomyces macrogynus ATCC 38327]|eukprot:KNE57227.1 hypothetical protein AMAG_18023 [Allomyces macrogynus ATCC 38327]
MASMPRSTSHPGHADPPPLFPYGYGNVHPVADAEYLKTFNTSAPRDQIADETPVHLAHPTRPEHAHTYRTPSSVDHDHHAPAAHDRVYDVTPPTPDRLPAAARAWDDPHARVVGRALPTLRESRDSPLARSGIVLPRTNPTFMTEYQRQYRNWWSESAPPRFQAPREHGRWDEEEVVMTVPRRHDDAVQMEPVKLDEAVQPLDVNGARVARPVAPAATATVSDCHVVDPGRVDVTSGYDVTAMGTHASTVPANARLPPPTSRLVAPPPPTTTTHPPRVPRPAPPPPPPLTRPAGLTTVEAALVHAGSPRPRRRRAGTAPVATAAPTLVRRATEHNDDDHVWSVLSDPGATPITDVIDPLLPAVTRSERTAEWLARQGPRSAALRAASRNAYRNTQDLWAKVSRRRVF